MATPIAPDRLVEILRAEGLKVVETKGWKTHERDDETGKAFGPVHGIMIHHTVTKGTANTVRICKDGYASLPGPLCHGVIAKNGTIHLISAGRANHAGTGDPDVLAAVKAESYGDKPPTTDVHDGESGVDGNDAFYGFECENLGDGEDPWPAEQLDAIEKASAAICRELDWKAKSVIGHLEWSDWKSDPKGFSMVTMRARIDKRLEGDKPEAPKPPVEQPKPPAKPKYQPFPGAAFFKSQPNSPIITEMGKRLVAMGCGRYNVGPGPRWSEADRRSYQKWQRKCGWLGQAADGWPGKDSWDRLKVPFVK
jgi:hypothetical protein